MSFNPREYTAGGVFYRTEGPALIEAIFYDGRNSRTLIQWVHAHDGEIRFSHIVPGTVGTYVYDVMYDDGITRVGPETWLVCDEGAFVSFDSDEFWDRFQHHRPTQMIYDAEHGLSQSWAVMLPSGRIVKITQSGLTGERTVPWEDVRAELGFTEDEELEIEERRQQQLAACAEFTAAYEAEHGPIPAEAYAEAEAFLDALPNDEATKAYVDQHHRYAPRHAAS